MRQSGIAGPVFISIGDAEKLDLFLTNNPDIPKSSILVDGYDFNAYNAVGFGKLLDNRANTIAGSKKLKAPKLGFKMWRQYLRNVMRLAPIPKGSKPNSIPEGVTRLGGTLAVNGPDLIYAYEDGVPGDYPEPTEVLSQFD